MTSSSPKTSTQFEIRVQAQAFQPGTELDRWCAQCQGAGAVVSFVGLVRDMNLGENVQSMHLEHYPGMTEKTLRTLCEEAAQRWKISDVCVIHRYGDLFPADPIVMVMTASAHRSDAFSACEFVMDYLKTQAPFWKRENTDSGPRWVEARESDEKAALSWGALDGSADGSARS